MGRGVGDGFINGDGSLMINSETSKYELTLVLVLPVLIEPSSKIIQKQKLYYKAHLLMRAWHVAQPTRSQPRGGHSQGRVGGGPCSPGGPYC